LNAARAEFLIPGPGPYALTHSVGCLTRAAAAALQRDFLTPFVEQGGDAWMGWLGIQEEFRAALSAVLGGAASDYCAQPGVTAGLVKIMGALPPPSRSRAIIIAAADSFPSLGFALQAASRLGYELRLMPRALSPDALASWRSALHADVCVALVTHVHSNTGRVAPMPAIASLCRERGVFCIVDVAQSAGILPFDVSELGADVVLGSCIKWLCGGPGAGFLWVRPQIIGTLQPLDTGWFSHADPFEFDIQHFVPAPDARRFWGGTPSVAPFAMAAASLRVLGAIGIAQILAHNRDLVGRFRDALPMAARAAVQPDAMGGTLCLSLGDRFDPISAALRSAEVRFDTRGDVVRISFHVCNTADQAQAIARAWHY